MATEEPRYRVERLLAKQGDAKLADLLVTLADCEKALSFSVNDRCDDQRVCSRSFSWRAGTLAVKGSSSMAKFDRAL
jgi:hypothetical protein